MNIERRALFGALAASALPCLAQAQDINWPTKPVRVVVPYAASGGTDILVRAIGEALRSTLPQPFIVENRAGAAGVIGSEVVARAEPDGHTLLVVVSTHVMNKYHLPSMPYDAIRDFTPIAMLTRNTMVLVAGANPDAGTAGYQPPSIRLAKPARLPFLASVRPETLVAYGMVMKVKVDTSGKPVDVKVHDSKLTDVYERNAMAAVKRWRFEPASLAGQPQEATVLVPVWFTGTSVSNFESEAMRHPRPQYRRPPQAVAGQ